MRFKELIIESKSIMLYHGSNNKFSKFDQNKARIANDLYGGGIAYFTDSIDLAKSYARVMTKKYGGKPIIYKVNLKVNKVFDINDVFTGKELMNFIEMSSNIESFLRGAGLLSYGTNKYKLISDLKSNKISLTGEQIFLGLSNGMNKTKLARDILQKMGYDALRYNTIGETNHSVYLAYNADDIDIIGTDTLEVSS